MVRCAPSSWPAARSSPALWLSPTTAGMKRRVCVSVSGRYGWRPMLHGEMLGRKECRADVVGVAAAAGVVEEEQRSSHHDPDFY